MILHEHAHYHLKHEQIIEESVKVKEGAHLIIIQILHERRVVRIAETGDEVHEDHEYLPLLVVNVALFDDVPLVLVHQLPEVLLDQPLLLLVPEFVGIIPRRVIRVELLFLFLNGDDFHG